MTDISFSSEEKKVIVGKIQHYFRTEMNEDIGSFEAEFLLDFFAKEIGGFFYNRGIYDAQSVLESQMENITEAMYQLEKNIS